MTTNFWKMQLRSKSRKIMTTIWKLLRPKWCMISATKASILLKEKCVRRMKNSEIRWCLNWFFRELKPNSVRRPKKRSISSKKRKKFTQNPKPKIILWTSSNSRTPSTSKTAQFQCVAAMRHSSARHKLKIYQSSASRSMRRKRR